MKLALLIPTFLVLTLLTDAAVGQNTHGPIHDDFSAALADLRAYRERMSVEGSTVEKATEMSEAFFARIDLSVLNLDELALVVDAAPFNYGAKAHALALATTQRLTSLVAQPGPEGALAAALRFQLSGPAGVPREVRNLWAAEYMKHPALTALVEGKHGGLALSAACSAARSDTEKELLLGLLEHLDATRSTSPTQAVLDYWGRIVRFVPEGERRQRMRAQLVNYLKATLAREAEGNHHGETREALEKKLAVLEGAEARGEFLGRSAPEINFLWSSREDWKKLADVRTKGGKVIVLDFWATWCGPCVESFPGMREFAALYRDYDVEIVGVTSLQGAIMGLPGGTVNCKGDPEKEIRLMAEYIKAHEITWPVAISREPVINPDYGVKGLPTVTIIAPDGTVRHSAPGFSPAQKRKLIDAILEEFHLRRPTPAS